MDEQMESGYPKIDITVLLRGCWRSFRYLMKYGILLMALLAGLMCFRSWRSYSPVYEASASFTVKVTNPFYGSQAYYNAAAAQQMAATFPHILSSSALNQRVMDELDIPRMPAMNVTVLGNTNIVTLAVRSGDPKLCYDVLNCVMEIYPSVAEFVVGPTTMNLMNESGMPQAPINGISYPRAAAKGIVMGFLIWAVWAVLYWLSHQTISSEEELGKLVNLECLGRVPLVRGYSKKKSDLCPLITNGSDKFGFNESIRLLRVRVERQMAKADSQVLLVTSTIANEGKTTVSVNLALSLAQKQKRVLLLDCDLRNPSVAKALGRKPGLGLSDYLQKKCKLDQILHHEDNDYLYSIYGGKPVSRPEQLLSSGSMKGLINAARNSFDYIILDTPPCALMADTTELFSMADCALLSVRQNFACRQQIVEGVQIMGDNDKPIIGCVMNMNVSQFGARSYNDYGYYGGYGHYGHYGSYGQPEKQE